MTRLDFLAEVAIAKHENRMHFQATLELPPLYPNRTLFEPQLPSAYYQPSDGTGQAVVEESIANHHQFLRQPRTRARTNLAIYPLYPNVLYATSDEVSSPSSSTGTLSDGEWEECFADDEE